MLTIFPLVLMNQLDSSSSIPFAIKRTTDSINNGKLKERNIYIDITPKKKSNPPSPEYSERNIVIDIQKKTDRVSVQTNTLQFEKSPQTVYRASPFRKERLNYSEYTNPVQTFNSSNFYNDSTVGNINNQSHKSRSVRLSSSTIAETPEENYHTLDPRAHHSPGKKRKQIIPQTEPRPKLRALHHFTPPRYEPRPPSHGKTYVPQLSEDSGSSVFINSSVELLSEKEEEEQETEKDPSEYESNDGILPIKRRPIYNFDISSSDLTVFSEEQSSESKRRSKSKTREANPSSTYSKYSHTDKASQENSGTYEYSQYSNQEMRSHHSRHSYSHGHHNTHSHSSHQKQHHNQESQNQDLEDRKRRRSNDKASEKDNIQEEKIAQTPARPRYTIHGTNKRTPPKTEPSKRDAKHRNIILDEYSDKDNQKAQSKHSHSKTQKVERSPSQTKETKSRSRSKSNVSDNNISKSKPQNSHTHSHKSRKSEPYYVLMKFTTSDELTEIDSEDIRYAFGKTNSSILQATKREADNINDNHRNNIYNYNDSDNGSDQNIQFQDLSNYYATLSSSKISNLSKSQKNNLFEEEEEEDGPKFNFNDNKNKNSKNDDDQENTVIDDYHENSLNDNHSNKDNNNDFKLDKGSNEDENEGITPHPFEQTDEEGKIQKTDKEKEDEDFQKLVEVPQVQERNMVINPEKEKETKNSKEYQDTQKGLIKKVEDHLNSQNKEQKEEPKENPVTTTKNEKANNSDSFQKTTQGLIEKVQSHLNSRGNINQPIPVEQPVQEKSQTTNDKKDSEPYQKTQKGLIAKVENYLSVKNRDIKIDVEDHNEDPSNTNEEPSNTNEEPSNTNEEPSNTNEDPSNTNEDPSNTNEDPSNTDLSDGDDDEENKKDKEYSSGSDLEKYLESDA